MTVYDLACEYKALDLHNKLRKNHNSQPLVLNETVEFGYILIKISARVAFNNLSSMWLIPAQQDSSKLGRYLNR